MEYLRLFKMPTAITITARSSSITNAFVNSIIPAIRPSEDEVKTALEILGMTSGKIYCAYCGNTSSEWDHFRPLVIDKKPTGYITEIRNLVPSCGKCNQSKGNKDWRVWIESNAKLSPKMLNVRDLNEKITRLAKYEKWGTPTKLNIIEIVGNENWKTHMRNLKRLQILMKEAQMHAEKIKARIT